MSRRHVPRLGPPVGGKYLLRRTCRHGRRESRVVELGYPVPGCVCIGCLVDQPVVAMLNIRQARDLRQLLDVHDDMPSTYPLFGPVTGPALGAMDLAVGLCSRVRRERRMVLQGTKASLLAVCTCLELRTVNLEIGDEVFGEVCQGCGHRLPSIQWLPSEEVGTLLDEMPMTAEYRRALRAASGPAPVAEHPAS